VTTIQLYTGYITRNISGTNTKLQLNMHYMVSMCNKTKLRQLELISTIEYTFK